MDQDRKQRQQGEHFGERRGEETDPDFICQLAAGGEKTDHINDVERQDDSGSANEDEIMYAIASNAEALLTIRGLLREVKARQ